MKLSLEQHAGLNEMARHLYKIEEIAERMGIEVDSLFERSKLFDCTDDLNLKANLYALATKRRHIFRHSKMNETADRSTIVNLSVIVNEDRF